jgi:methionyl-tRNA formyltransferase
MRVIFMGSPEFALPCLDRLINSPDEVIAVVTQPDRPKGRGKKLTFTPVKERALAYGIPVLQPENVNHPGSVEKLKALAPEVLVVVAFGQLLKEELLNLPPLGCINVHASLLPKYRGAAPIHWAIINGEKETGVTTMFMDRGMDTGDLILKRTVPIGDNDTTGVLHDKLAEAGGILLRETLDLLQKHQAPRTAQEHSLATYAPLLTREHERIDWTKKAREVHNLVRGMNPWPGAYTTFENKTMKIWETEFDEAGDAAREAGESPGTVLEVVNGQGVRVRCGEGSLWLTVLQPEGKQTMAAEAWARGARLTKGSTLA